MDDTGGDIMVNSEETVTYNSYSDRTEYETSVRLEVPISNGYSHNTDSDVPEYATITSRLRQHDPPPYVNHGGDSSSSRKSLHDEENDDDKSPQDDINTIRSRDEEDKIEVLDSLLDETSKEPELNGNPPGAGWTVLGAASLAGLAAGSGKGDSSGTSSIAEKNSKILEQFEDKPRQKDECLVDCIYYTTTCCECTII